MSEASGLFGPIFGAGPVAGEVGDAAWLRAMLDAEAALAGALADAGLVEREHAERIADACRPALHDPAAIGAGSVDVGNPAAPLATAVAERAGDPAGRYVHYGATSQDIVDTAAMLVSGRALGVLDAEVRDCADTVAELAQRHVDTIQPGRTLLQQALPVTFGLTAAGWLSGLDAAARRLAGLRPRLAAQLGGATGTLATYGDRGLGVHSAFARRLGLAEPALPWHTERSRIAEVAGALGELAGVVSGMARTVVLLAQTEVGEVSEEGPPGSGGSSAMPHKQNPVAAVAARACAQRAPGHAGTLLAAMGHEYQRAAGDWHAEWEPLADLLCCTGAAVHWMHTSLRRLHVHPERMREHVGVLPLAERVTAELAAFEDRGTARDAVADCCRRAAAGEGELADLLAADPLVGKHLRAERIAELLDPAGYLGSTRDLVGRALDEHRERRDG